MAALSANLSQCVQRETASSRRLCSLASSAKDFGVLSVSQVRLAVLPPPPPCFDPQAIASNGLILILLVFSRII